MDTAEERIVLDSWCIYLIAQRKIDTKEQRSLFESWCIYWDIASIFPLDDDGQYRNCQIHLLYCAWLQGQVKHSNIL